MDNINSEKEVTKVLNDIIDIVEGESYFQCIILSCLIISINQESSHYIFFLLL